MKPLVVRIPVRKQALSQHGPSKAFCDNKRIIAQCAKKFTQHLWLFRPLCHAIHFGL
jgi:hypothetical protein